MRVLTGAAALLVLVLLVPAGAQAHASGSGTIAVAGDFILTPAGTLTDSFHAFLSDMGLPAHAGDTLRYWWSVNNGSGGAVYFEIHDHAPPAGYRIHYSYTGLTETGEWPVPGAEDYMIFWQNPDADPIYVAYSFSLLAGAVDYTPTIITVLAIGGFFGALWFLWRGKGEDREDREEERPRERRLP
ncbi:MAG: hypothetical protein ACE5LS_07870 [Thermoplasmata archaeon]